jgi:hypothetical protein
MRLILVFATAVLGGCMSTSKIEPSANFGEVDQARMSAVEQYASRLGVRVLWINPPTKPIAAGS